METKKCSICKKIKSINDFYRSKTTKDGYRDKCKSCFNGIQKEWYKNNLGRIKEWHKSYRKRNSEKIRECNRKYRKNNSEKIKKYAKKYRQNNTEKIRKSVKEWQKNNPNKVREKTMRWRKNNPDKIRAIERKNSRKKRLILNNRLNNRISTSIRRSLKENRKNNYWEALVNFTLQDLIIHLEKQFKEGMSWDNYGKWHIDHKKPLASFSFNSYEGKEFKECWSLENLQPLWAEENIRKSNKIF